jgi:hypothetical protein
MTNVIGNKALVGAPCLLSSKLLFVVKQLSIANFQNWNITDRLLLHNTLRNSELPVDVAIEAAGGLKRRRELTGMTMRGKWNIPTDPTSHLHNSLDPTKQLRTPLLRS